MTKSCKTTKRNHQQSFWSFNASLFLQHIYPACAAAKAGKKRIAKVKYKKRKRTKQYPNKLTNCEADLLAMMTNVISRKCCGCRSRGQTHPYIHILKKRPGVDSCHKTCYLHRPWPFGHVVGRVRAMMPFTPGNKTGRRKLLGQSGASSRTKAAASESSSRVNFCLFPFPFALSQVPPQQPAASLKVQSRCNAWERPLRTSAGAVRPSGARWM